MGAAGGDDSDSSSSDSMSTEETTPVRSSDIHAIIEAIRKDRRKEAEGFKQTLKEMKEELKEELKEEINKVHKELKKLNRVVLRTQSEQFNGSSGDGPPAPRSEPNHMHPPRFSLKIKSKMKDAVEKGNSIITDDGDSIVVDLYDGDHLIAPSHPLASARVMMVVIDGKFNNSRCSWSKEDFEKSIKRPREGNSAIGDVNQRTESIVSNCIFNLEGGTRRHSGATIWENSGNSKVRLGVMLLSHLEERVLEGVSEKSFHVRDVPKKVKKQKQAPVGCGQERNGPMPNTQYSSRPTLNTQTAGNISGQLQLQAYSNMPSSSITPRDNTLGADPQRSVEPSTNQQPSSFPEGHRHISAGGAQTSTTSGPMNQTMYSGPVNQTMYSLTGKALVGFGQELNGTMPYSSSPTFIQTAGNISGQLQLQEYTNMPSSTPRDNTLGIVPRHWVAPSTNQQPSSFSEGYHHISAGVQTPMISDSMNPDGGVQTWTLDDAVRQPILSPIGGPYSEHIIRPVRLLWDRPGVEPSKRWNLLDQLMPEHYDSLTAYSQGPYQRLFFNEQALSLKKMMRDLQITTIPKEVMQTHRNRGVLIQPLEPDDSDDKPPLKRKLRNKYQLRFVNKVCEAYYTGEIIKADDGNLLNVALYDENNAKITSGPLSSASVEVVVLHSDFNATGQDYWASEEFSSCVVCPQSTKEPPAIGGDRVLVLVDGQASLGDAFFQKSSIYARTGKFKMGVMLASTPDERVQEGISESFWVWNRKGGRTGCTAFQRWHSAINAIIFILRLRSETYRTRKMRRPLLSRTRSAGKYLPPHLLPFIDEDCPNACSVM